MSINVPSCGGKDMSMKDIRLEQADPCDLEGLREAIRDNDKEQKTCPIEMDRIIIQNRAIERLPEIINEFAKGDKKKVLLVSDATSPYLRGSKSVKEEIYFLLSRSFDVNWFVFDNHDHVLHADDEESKKLEERIKAFDPEIVVGIGGGTVTDICKYSTYQVDQKETPLVIVQTALSVNAFSDGISIMIKNGVKDSIETRYPNVLIIDLDVIEKAPVERNLAGYGDCLSTLTGPLDWYMANALNMNHSYTDIAVDIMHKQDLQLLEASARLAQKDQEALRLLARVLTISGLAMGIAGESCPSSGSEHIMTHLLDMCADIQNRDVAFHGAQVAVGTVFATIAWDILLEEFEPKSVDIDACFPTEEEMKPIVHEAFSWISEQAAEECFSRYQKKLALWREQKETLKAFLENWDTFRTEIKERFVKPEYLVKQMHEAGCPTHYAQMTPMIDKATGRWAVQCCHLYRNRFTLIDFLYYIGWWNDEFVERVMERAGALDAGL